MDLITNCNCAERISTQLLEKMQDEAGFTETIEIPVFVNRSIYPIIQPYFPVEGKYRQGRRTKKFKVSMYPAFCPFCGKKIIYEHMLNNN